MGYGVEGYNWACVRPERVVNIFVSSGLAKAEAERNLDSRDQSQP